MSQAALRRAAVAGSWYPGTSTAIVAELEGYLSAAGRLSVPGRLVALISPHAGLRYSGPVAAHGYSLLRGRRSATAVLVGPSHRVGFEGVAVYPRGAFETPLGRVPIAEELAARLVGTGPPLVEAYGPHGQEHSLEMQLPFLQYLVPDLSIVPLLMGSQSREEVLSLSAALERALGSGDEFAASGTLLVASSDLSHYHPAPEAQRLDALVLDDVERMLPDRLLERLSRSHEHACGGGPIVAVMKAALALGADRATILRYADSGDAGEHDKSRVVGYLSAALSVAS